MFVSSKVAEVVRSEQRAGVPEPNALLPESPGTFAATYNQRPLLFQHGLAGHELFELPALLALARRTPNHRDTYWSNGKPLVDDRWERNSEGRLSLDDSITGIATNNSMVILKHAEQDLVYGPLLKAFLSRVVNLAGDAMRQDVVVGEVLILLSSPERLTPYHMDAEVNYLVQVTGNKTVRVYDQTDRSLVTHEERERYFAGDYNSAAYPQGKRDEAAVFELPAGQGVHIPVFAPHWVQTHSNVSVALSVNYELRSVKRLERIYHINRLLRRAKLSPAAPGTTRFGDAAKLLAASAVAGIGQLRRRPEPAAPGWAPAS